MPDHAADPVDIECFEFEENQKTVARTGLGPKPTTFSSTVSPQRYRDSLQRGYDKATTLSHWPRRTGNVDRHQSCQSMGHNRSSLTTAWFMDGNFKVSPTIFTQVCVIRDKLDQSAVSCVYAFLPGKEQHFYVELRNLRTVTCN